MQDKLLEFKAKLEHVQSMLDDMADLAIEIRTYYKHQNDETRSLSEDFIHAFKSYNVEDMLRSTDELISYCEYWEK